MEDGDYIGEGKFAYLPLIFYLLKKVEVLVFLIERLTCSLHTILSHKIVLGASQLRFCQFSQ